MDVVSWLLSRAYVNKTLVGMGALKGAPAMISSIVDNPDGTHDITFSWKDNSDVTHTSILTVANGETPTITSTEIEGGHTLTFATTNPSQTVSFNVMDGEEGQRGVSVIRADVDANNYLRLELSDGNVINAGQIKTVSMVDNTLSLESANPVENRVITSALNNKVNKVSGKQLSTEDFTTAEKNKLANIENGAQVNTLENLIINGEEATIVDKKIALNIITSAVSNLQNYYLKSETYTKTEVEELIGSTVGVTIEIVQQLPTIGQTNVIYFLPTETANVYSQYIYTSTDGWVLIGSTSVDLSNYYTKGQVDTLLNGKQNVLTIDAFPMAMSNNPVASGGVYSAIAQMQPQFQFTNMPVASQSNYGFVYQYVGNAGTYEPNMFYRCVYNTYAGEYRWEEVIFHATVTVDSELSSTSTNPVQNKVVKEALDAKQDIMQFSTMPSAQDNLGKIVQYTGATTATYQNACFYKAVYDSEHDTYVWNIVRFSADISVDNVLSDVSENPVQNKVITQKFDEYKTTFTGTEEEWDALTSEEQNVYDIINITNDGDVLNLGVYLEKTTAMPVASEDVENKIYLYTGTTTQDFKKGVVYQCVSDGQDPATYSWVALIDFGTAALKNSTDRVSPNNTDLVESQSVYSAINNALSSIYTPRGDITCAELTSSLLISDNIGNVYEVSDSGTTTALFLQGAGHPIAVGDNVGIINAGQGRILFNLMANAFDLTDYQKKDLANTIEGATTVEGALSALSTNKQSKTLTTSVESATTVEGALGALSDNKQAKTLTTSVESQTTVEGALGALSTNKASKVSGATNGNLAGLDSNGNLTDSGKKASDFGTADEIADIVNVYGAKNLMETTASSHTQNGITKTVNADGSFTLNGTATDNTYFYWTRQTEFPTENIQYTYSIETSAVWGIGKAIAGIDKRSETAYIDRYKSIYADGTTHIEGTFTGESGYYAWAWIFIPNGTQLTDVIVKGMIRLASVKDNTYVPYAKSNQQLTQDSVTWDDLSEVGAVNYFNNTASSPQTDKGVTYTVDATTKKITATGTNDGTANSYIVVKQNLKAGTYRCSGCPSGGSNGNYRIVWDVNDRQNKFDYGDGVIITLATDGYVTAYFNIMKNYAISGSVVFEPMITSLDYNGPYVPYAKTNRELTDESELITLPATKNDSIIGSSFMVKVRKQYNAVYITGYFNTSVAANRNDLLFTISGLSFLNTDDHFYATIMNSHGVTLFAEIYPDGTVKLSNEEGMASGYYIVQAVLLAK